MIRMGFLRGMARGCVPLLLPLALASSCAPRPEVQKSETKNQAQGDQAQGKKPEGQILKDLPERVDPRANYLFYLHGKIIEEKGIRPTDPRYGVYEYEQILDALGREGFVVISEARAKGTDPKEYAAKVVGQIEALIGAGVPPRNITVVGASKGSVITMLVSTGLKNRDANFVIMSNCNDWVLENFNPDLYGNVLSIYDEGDEFGASCQKIFDHAAGLNRRKEIVLKLGLGHAILYKPMREWIDPAAAWARGVQ